VSTTTAPTPLARRVRLGEFKGQVSLVSVIPSSTKPAIFTRVDLPAVPATDTQAEIPAESITHAVRLTSTDSIRIGLDELRGAFVELIGKSDEEVLIALMTGTDSFIGRAVTVSIEPQLDKVTKAPVRGTNGQAYYNVRLRPNLRNIEESKAKGLVSMLLSRGHNAAHDIDDSAFQE
jgi:hypothetical protein